MPASLADQDILSSNTVFQSRVRQAMISTCIAISSENLTLVVNPPQATAQTALTLTTRRKAYAAAAQSNPANYQAVWAQSIASDASVIGDATEAGTVVLTTTNIATQQAKVTDAHISAAASGQFNSFFTTT